jgi:hypothetical protein
MDTSTSSSATKGSDAPWGPDHPLWTLNNQGTIPEGDPSPEASLHSSANEDSDYEDSDTNRKKRNRERRERHERNMAHPNNTTYVAMHTDRKQKKGEKRRKRQEEKASLTHSHHRGGRGGGRGGGERDRATNRNAIPQAQHQHQR